MPTPKIETLPADVALSRETDLLAQVAEAPDTHAFWLWQSPQALVAPRKLAQKPRFAEASAHMAAQGWPVYLRATGGDVTPQGAGIVNVTHVYAVPPTKAFDMAREYDRLCQPIETALGPGASRGWQPGAFCDGAHNVQWEGRKFAGTAMRFRPCRTDKTRYAVLAHALMLFEPPSQEAVDAINAFLAAIDEDRVIRRDAHAGLPDGLDVGVFTTRLHDAFTSARP